MLNVFDSDLDDASEYSVGQIAGGTKLGWSMTKASFSAEAPGKTSGFGQHKPGEDEQSEVQSFVLEWKKPCALVKTRTPLTKKQTALLERTLELQGM